MKNIAIYLLAIILLTQLTFQQELVPALGSGLTPSCSSYYDPYSTCYDPTTFIHSKNNYQSTGWMSSYPYQPSYFQWVQIHSDVPVKWLALETKFALNHDHRCTSYTIWYTNDNIKWESADDTRVFTNVNERGAQTLKRFQKPFFAKTIRARCEESTNRPGFFFEAYFQKQ